MSTMKFGYARVSTDGQDTAMQEEALRKEGCDQIFLEKASGARRDRPELAKILEKARKGDCIVVWRLDRLARSVAQLVQIGESLEQRGIDLVSLQDRIETVTANGKLHFHMLAALAQFERDLTRERINSGLATARSMGRLGGRPKTPQSKIDIAFAELGRGATITEAAKTAKISRSTLSRAIAVSKTHREAIDTRKILTSSSDTAKASLNGSAALVAA